MKTNAFAKYAWGLLAYNILVILWGAFVRATGSGAGCGAHWPLCNGEVIPRGARLETLIEFSHRLSSGLLGILVLVLLIWALRSFRHNRAVRLAAIWTMIFVLAEAILGAGLVKFEWVAADDSMARVYTIAFHLVNTFLLLGANTLTAWFASGGRPFRLWNHGIVTAALLAAIVGMLVLGASGAITALGDTLYLSAGLDPAHSPVVAWLIELRIYHPIMAFVVYGLLILATRICVARQAAAGQKTVQSLATWLLTIATIQLLAGALNVFLKAPVWMQIMHLLLSDLLWVLVVLLAATALSQLELFARAVRPHTSQTDLASETPS
ncbi:MAG: COX15/CtaA family protein [Caldilineaceae bacterium]|nr:COX15/CtaA family protein [Caldilineaceae bacterium]